MRRRLLKNFTWDGSYDDSRNLINRPGFAEGSCNQLLLGDGPTPFKGYTSKGTSTGVRIGVQLGSDWGGMQDYTAVTASGSLIEDFSKTIYTIGSGKPTKKGVPIAAYASTPSTIVLASASDVDDGTDTFTENAHGFVTGTQIRYTATSSVAVPGLSVGTTYFVINLTANTFQLATTYANALAGTEIVISGTGTGNQTFTVGVDMTASTLLKVGSVQLSDYLYTYFDQAGIARPDAPNIEVPSAPGSDYTGLINGAISFKIAGIRDRSNVGSNITSPDADVKSVASTTSAVVVPQNKTVKITFPTAETGQTHWAVFATKAGFGGTGVHYRVGYRTTSDEDATWIFGIPETTVAAASRVLEFDFRDGDLIPEEAWLHDYVPPAGTHFVRLENIGVVLGCYDGTVGAVSLPNFFESYHPRHLIYFPEAVTAVLHRQIDDFAYVACRNSIHVLQYVGYRGDDYPSCTISTISPEVGIAQQSNWASGMGLIMAFIEGSGLVLIGSEGEINYEFGKEVAWLTKNWAATDVVVGFDPKTRSFVAGNGTSSVSFSLQTQMWSTPVYLTDFGVTGNWLSATNTRGEMIVSVNNAGSHTAYSYHLGATRTPCVSMSHWQKADRSVNIYEIDATVRQGANTEPVVIGLHSNLFKTFVRGCSVTSGSANLTVPSGTFTSTVTGKLALITGTDVGGSGVHYLIVRLTHSNSTTATMSNRSTGSAVNAQANLSNVMILVGEDFEAITPTASVDQHLYSAYPSLQDCRSFCVSVYQPTDASTGGIIDTNVYGTMQETSEAKL